MKPQMSKRIVRTIVLLAAVLLGFDAARAQTTTPDRPAVRTRQIVAGVSGSSTRFTSLGALIQMRLQVIGPTGETVFDSDLKPANLIDWSASDKQGQKLADGSYLCIVTVKDSSGQITQAHATASLLNQSVSLRQSDSSLLTGAQTQTAGDISENAGLTILEPGESSETAVLAHDGATAHLVTGSGGLTVSGGDFFANKMIERLRLSAEGNLGIGIANPRARLDVDGLIRTSQGIVFSDGTIQTTAANGESGIQAPDPNLVGGRLFGSTNQSTSSAKAGKGKKSVSPETLIPDDLTVNGNIIFTPALARDITMQQNIGGIRIFAGPTLTTTPTSAAIQFFGTGHAGFPGQAFIDSGANNSAAVIFRTTGTGGTITERMRVTATGNVGIGTSAPFFRLEVNEPGLNGLRVVTNTSGGKVASFGSQGTFDIDGPFIPGGRLRVQQDGNVGIGVDSNFAINPWRFQAFTPGNLGLRVETQTAGGTVASFGGIGDFQIDKAGVVAGGGRFIVKETGETGIGVTSPLQKLHVSGTGVVRALVNSDSNAGFALGLNNQQKWSLATTNGDFLLFNDAIGFKAILVNGSTNNVGIGRDPFSDVKLTVHSSTGTGLTVDVAPGQTVAEFGPNGEFGIDDAAFFGGRFRVTEDAVVLINHPPIDPLNDFSERLVVNGTIRTNLGGGGFSPVCWNPAGQELTFCSSSIRYKENVNPLLRGLDLVERLRPVTFNWKQGGIADLGLIAEEVAKEEPLLATYDTKGVIQGVKYERVGVVLLNAVKEQQVQIASQQAQIKQQTAQIQRQAGQLQNQGQLFKQQQAQLAGLKRLVCKTHPAARVCK